jgi:biotin operon repressor
MQLLSEVRRRWRRTVGDRQEEADVDDEGGPTTRPTDAGGYRGPDAYDFDPAAIESRADIPAQTGYTPAEFVERLLEAEDGSLPQQALTDYTDLSEAVVSRQLQELEDEGVVVRMQLGREKLVFLPEQAPPVTRNGQHRP